MILKGTLGEDWGGIDRYATRAKGARMLASTFGGDTIPERVREAAALRSARPNLKLVVAQIILAHDPLLKDLSDEQWLRAVEIAKEEHDLRDAAYCVVLHPERHKHLHLYYMRVRPDGSLVSDSHSYRKNETAARRIEQELGLPPPPPVPKEQKVGDRVQAGKARRRGQRKHQQQDEVFMETTELSRRAFEALSSSDSIEVFEQELRSREILVEWSPNHAGLKFLPVGSSTWVKGSTANRELSGAKVMTVLKRNADLRREARQAAEAAIAAVGAHAHIRAASVLPGMPGGESVPDSPGVVPADAAVTGAHATRALEPQGDGLDFLSLTSARPSNLPLDAGTVSDGVEPASSSKPVDDQEHMRLAHEREAAEAALDVELRKMELSALYDLKKCAEIPPVFLTLEALVRLVNLMIRILSFGLVARANVFADLRTAKESLSARADQELQRRKRTPTSVADRLKMLASETKAMEGRKTLLEARTNTFWLQTPGEVALDAVERQRDVAAARARSPTIAAHRGAVRDIDASLHARADEIARVEARIPIGMAGVLLSATDAVRFARARLAKLKAQQHENDKKRARLVLALESLIDEFKRNFQAQIAEGEERVKAQRIATTQEIEQLTLELRERIPAERRAIERQDLADRQRHGVDDDTVPKFRG